MHRWGKFGLSETHDAFLRLPKSHLEGKLQVVFIDLHEMSEKTNSGKVVFDHTSPAIFMILCILLCQN